MSNSTPSRTKQALNSSTFGSSKRFGLNQEEAERPSSYLAFKSFDHRANGRAVSEVGSFSTAATTSFFTKPSTPVAFYQPPKGVGGGVSRSHGVKRTASRFSEFEDDSVGPIYAPPRQDRVKSTKFCTAPRFPSPKPQGRNGEPQPRPESRANDLFPDLKKNSSNDLMKQKKSEVRKCTFGSRPGSRMSDDKSAETALNHSTFVEEVPKYKGKWGKSTRSQRQTEVLPGPGHFLKNEYQNTTAKWSFGRRTRDNRSQTPGPGAYNIGKFSKVSKPDAPTFARKMRDTLDFAAGKDSPGPAVYSVLR